MGFVKKITAILLFTSSLHLMSEKKVEETLQYKYNFNCPEKRIVIVIPSYNNEQWCIQNLDSVRTQNYHNFIVIYLNDRSTDKTADIVAEYIQKYALKSRFILVNNKIRVGALENLYKAIHACQNDDIIVTLDGDDWFAHANVLKIINSTYQDPDIWLTYGQYKAIEGDWWWCTEFSQKTIKQNTFRYPTAFPSHLRTFYAGLFKLIHIEDLFYYDGVFYPMTWDKAMMFPMIEMSGGNFKRIEDILYIYNDINPINDHKVNEGLQKHLSYEILRKEPYKQVTWETIMNAKTKKYPLQSHKMQKRKK